MGQVIQFTSPFIRQQGEQLPEEEQRLIREMLRLRDSTKALCAALADAKSQLQTKQGGRLKIIGEGQ